MVVRFEKKHEEEHAQQFRPVDPLRPFALGMCSIACPDELVYGYDGGIYEDTTGTVFSYIKPPKGIHIEARQALLQKRKEKRLYLRHVCGDNEPPLASIVDKAVLLYEA
eukprot:253483-Pelagomonas_calceolata.AAC.1